jgi:hypothetical protein
MSNRFYIKFYLLVLYTHLSTKSTHQYINRDLIEDSYTLKLRELNGYNQRQFDAMSRLLYPSHSNFALTEFTYDYVSKQLSSFRIDEHSYTFLNRIDKIIAAIDNVNTLVRYIYIFFLEPAAPRSGAIIKNFKPNLFTEMRKHLRKVNITYENQEVAINCKKSAFDCIEYVGKIAK